MANIVAARDQDRLAPGWRGLAGPLVAVVITGAVFLTLLLVEQASWIWAAAGFAIVSATLSLVLKRRSAAEELRAEDPVTSTVDADVAALAEALGEPAILIDRRGVVLHRNGSAALEWPAMRVGDPLSLSLRAPAVVAALEAAISTGEPQTAELQQPPPNQAWHRVRAAPLPPGKAGSPRTILVTLRNLTEQKRVDAMRVDFIANVSHELRTPLTSLLGFTDTLLGPAANDPVARQKFLTLMRAQATRMSKLIEDLLSLSRIEMRQHVRPTGSVDLTLLVGEVVAGLEGQLKEAGVDLQVSTPAEAMVTGEREELYEVVENLLENAVKYGAPGKVEVTIASSERRGFAFRLSVADQGPGVAAEHVPRLTERFYRADAEASRRKKGTGLGLAIVKHIVQRHRGDLSIVSELGEGTRVDVWLRR